MSDICYAINPVFPNVKFQMRLASPVEQGSAHHKYNVYRELVVIRKLYLTNATQLEETPPPLKVLLTLQVKFGPAKTVTGTIVSTRGCGHLVLLADFLRCFKVRQHNLA